MLLMLGVSAVMVSAPTRRTSPSCADRTYDSLGKAIAWVPKRGRVSFAVGSLTTSVRGTAGLVRIQGPVVQLRRREPAGDIEGGALINILSDAAEHVSRPWHGSPLA